MSDVQSKSSTSTTDSRGFGFMKLMDYYSDIASDSENSNSQHSDNDEIENTKKIKLDSDEKAEIKEKVNKEEVAEYFKSLRNYLRSVRAKAARIEAELTARIDAAEKEKNVKSEELAQNEGVDVAESPNFALLRN
ncbi:unnamed protein product [Rotaria socialis]|uniref:Uncharacterized protein n=1 Tax=Rotaria socialis TaxID=392032 RepID=A0A819C2H4_9BILA|nr:unnamed protein product [Rotaria socialis]CAF4907241.1 unnamed protein product [Rotaria socialis]